jgi:hypothetical protein
MLTAPFNRDRISPIYKAGGVNFNAKVNAYDIEARLSRLQAPIDSMHDGRPLPYYGPPSGPHANSFKVMKMSEFVFRNRAFTNLEMANPQNVTPSFNSDIGINVCSTLNLLGDYDESLSDEDMRESIMQQLQVFGVVVADNEKNNDSAVTLMAGGEETLRYNGVAQGNAGDWLILYCPPRSEIANKVGGTDDADEYDGGRVTLRLAPYDSRIHSHTPKYIYTALKEMEKSLDGAKKRYLESYLVMCTALYASICKIVAAGLYALLSENYVAGANVAQAISNLTNANVGNTRPDGRAQALRRAVRDAVFAGYIRQVTLGAKNNHNVDVRAMEGIGLYMVATADHVRTVLERVICRALTPYSPKLDVDVSFIQPSR